MANDAKQRRVYTMFTLIYSYRYAIHLWLIVHANVCLSLSTVQLFIYLSQSRECPPIVCLVSPMISYMLFFHIIDTRYCIPFFGTMFWTPGISPQFLCSRPQVVQHPKIMFPKSPLGLPRAIRVGPNQEGKILGCFPMCLSILLRGLSTLLRGLSTPLFRG